MLYMAFLSQFSRLLQRCLGLVQVHHILFSDDVAFTLELLLDPKGRTKHF